MRGLTGKQKATLDYIYAFLKERGRTPTVREVRDAMGLSAISSAKQRLDALRTKGFLRDERHITLTHTAQVSAEVAS